MRLLCHRLPRAVYAKAAVRLAVVAEQKQAHLLPRRARGLSCIGLGQSYTCTETCRRGATRSVEKEQRMDLNEIAFVACV